MPSKSRIGPTTTSGLPSKFQPTTSSSSSSAATAGGLNRPTTFTRAPTTKITTTSTAMHHTVAAAIQITGAAGIVAREASDIGAYDGGFERDVTAGVKGEAGEMLAMDSSSVDKYVRPFLLVWRHI